MKIQTTPYKIFIKFMQKPSDKLKVKVCFFRRNNMKHYKVLILSIFTLVFGSLPAWTDTFFSGYAGGKFDYAGDPTTEEYNPDLKLQAFFSGQLNFSKNIWSHIEFSLDTQDLISESIFHETQAKFQVDELSLIFRNQSDSTTKYFSTFMGTYDPIGSDIFLQRYFGAEPIASKITDSWLGLAGSILYPHFGVGVSEVSRMNGQPLAGGFYLYMNHENDNYYVFNGDIRGACTYRYFTADIAGGIGIPFIDSDPQYQGAWQEVNFHLGTTILVGNNYTTSLFLQAGIYNLTSSKITGNTINPSETYILLEPRFLVDSWHLNVSVFSLPQDTVDKFMYIHDTLGANVNLYTNSITVGTQRFTTGFHVSATLPHKSFASLFKPAELLSEGVNFNVTPYVSTSILSGELHTQAQIQTRKLAQKNWGNAISVDIGYKTTF